ncbi:hypothetical protein FPV67DRAFT_1667728 [Lyophyllum atratum]|nr:hypothetical protein FPV67DRAFT_1667728 [Lyophyllum atratum]
MDSHTSVQTIVPPVRMASSDHHDVKLNLAHRLPENPILDDIHPLVSQDPKLSIKSLVDVANVVATTSRVPSDNIPTSSGRISINPSAKLQEIIDTSLPTTKVSNEADVLPSSITSPNLLSPPTFERNAVGDIVCDTLSILNTSADVAGCGSPVNSTTTSFPRTIDDSVLVKPITTTSFPRTIDDSVLVKPITTTSFPRTIDDSVLVKPIISPTNVAHDSADYGAAIGVDRAKDKLIVPVPVIQEFSCFEAGDSEPADTHEDDRKDNVNVAVDAAPIVFELAPVTDCPAAIIVDPPLVVIPSDIDTSDAECGPLSHFKILIFAMTSFFWLTIFSLLMIGNGSRRLLKKA